MHDDDDWSKCSKSKHVRDRLRDMAKGSKMSVDSLDLRSSLRIDLSVLLCLTLGVNFGFDFFSFFLQIV